MSDATIVTDTHRTLVVKAADPLLERKIAEARASGVEVWIEYKCAECLGTGVGRPVLGCLRCYGTGFVSVRQ